MENKIEDFLAKSYPKQTIGEHTNDLLKHLEILNSLGYIKSCKLYQDLKVACKYHDYGKANSEFQSRITSNGKKKFDTEKEVPHNVLSVFFIDKTLCKNYEAVCYAVAYHHFKCSIANVYHYQEDLIEKLVNELPGAFDYYDSYEFQECFNEIINMKFDKDEKKYAVILKGFLHKCDYSASAGLSACEIKNDFLSDCLENWRKHNNKTQKEITYNELQQFCSNNSDKDIIVTAPTGMGKTEAGLLWCGNNKGFFVLPLRTAINAMYKRFRELAGENFEDRVSLIHSDMKSEYLKIDEKNFDGDDFISYCIRSKQMSIPLTVCTPDQIFDFVLKYPGYEYKLAIASYSKFIIDEIQMYSAELMAAIICAIKIIHSVGGKIAVVTATLPPFVRSELLKIFGEDIPQADFSEYGILKHNVKVFEDKLNSDFIYDKICELKSDKVKKFLVVCNSIDTANKIFNEISNMFNDQGISVNLFHSGFIKKDRKEKETKILSANERPDKTEIWVSTSVVEASLDIDFDILFTELLDLFSLFQRFGRVNRKGKKDYSSTNCFVFTELQGNAERYKDKFTDEKIHQLSKDAICTVDGIITEQEKSRLIEDYLAIEKLKGTKYLQTYNEAFNYFDNLNEYISDKNTSFRTIERIDVIPESVYNENKEIINENLEILKSKNLTPKALIEANDKILQFTVSVSPYNIYDRNYNEDIRLGKNSIPILKNCEYSPEKGISIIKPEKGQKNNNIYNIDNIF